MAAFYRQVNARRRLYRSAFWLLVAWLWALPGQSVSPTHASANRQPGAPLPGSYRFVENRGQVAENVAFYSIAGPIQVWLTEDSLWFSMPHSVALAGAIQPAGAAQNSLLSTIRLKFLQQHKDLELEAVGRQAMTYAHYRGSDPKDWAEGLAVWSGLRVRGIAPGLALLINGRDDGLKLELEGSAEYQGGHSGPLFGLEDTPQNPESGANDLPGPAAAGVDSVFQAFLPSSAFPYTVRHGDQEHRVAPVRTEFQGAKISPAASGVISYGTYLGGSLWDEAVAITSDAKGRLYLGGHTQSLDFPSGPGLTATQHNVDAFVVRLDPTGGGDDYFAVFQGSDLQNGEEYTTAIALTPGGELLAAGRTDSVDFPTTLGAYDTTYNGGLDGFIVQLNLDGTLAYATLLGGPDADLPTGVAAGQDGSAHLTGGTFSSGFPTTAGAFDQDFNGDRDIFYAEISPDGASLVYSTFVGGLAQDQAEDIAIEGGAVSLTGWTRSDDFPVSPGAVSESFAGGFDAFALQLNPAASSLIFSTYLGGADEDRGYAVAVGPLGEILISGQTNSPAFPVSGNGFDTSFGGGICSFTTCPDGFLIRVSTDGSQLLYGTYLGGENLDQVLDLAIASTGEIYLSGVTESADFPLALNAIDRTLGGGRDAFLAVFEPGFSSLRYSSFLGGTDWDDGIGIQASSAGEIWIAGKTRSTDFPITPNAFATAPAGDYDGFAVRLDLGVLNMVHLPIGLRPP